MGVTQREAREKETGKKPRGKAPKPPMPEPQAKEQVNLTDEESRIMPTTSVGFQPAYNEQAGVDVKTHLVIEQHVTQRTNDKQEIEPALGAIGHLPKALDEAENLLVDTGFFSEANVKKCTKSSLVPFILEKRERHNLPLTDAPERSPNFPRMPRRCSPCDIGSRPGKEKRFMPHANSSWELSLASLSRCKGLGNFCCKG